ncbi:hypothetical protein BKH42_06775 [Helicobacter sp. 13S00482-2]|uniref:Jag N-terminal domain-containing protein n=1 Tax=Helicobacter sp. 13S00482-2 TaxID=1476200 RepID=UPI000BA51EEC|nr:Jag N-terminal domain-containing protein [Helicobacter sp. 13S00482-2]PAF53314.1 hypothetical protein BKH42_06775 [Helicobacter sp. 13S00482-2]
MKKVVAKTLQEAITQASLDLGCSVTELDYEIIQTPSSGFFGMGKKDAIIVATIIKDSNALGNNKDDDIPKKEITPQTSIATQNQKNSLENTDENFDYEEHKKSRPSYFDHHLATNSQKTSHHQFEMNKSDIDETFFKEIQDPQEITQEIEDEVKMLFASMPYKINKIEVGIYDSQTILITLDGDDSALMIGEKGYRYKALSYLLFNWIQPKYGYNIRLEIAQFLKNQEEAIDIYLQNVISTIIQTGKAQTKPLDGVLAYIALKKLRETFPNKYVSFRINAQDERYIVVNDFIKS